MYAIWVLTVLAVASADVSHLGYHYKVPQTSYGFPSYQYNSAQYSPSVSYSSGPSISFKGSQGQYLGSSFSHTEPAQVGLSGSGYVADANISPSTVSPVSSLGSGFISSSTVSPVSSLGSGFISSSTVSPLSSIGSEFVSSSTVSPLSSFGNGFDSGLNSGFSVLNSGFGSGLSNGFGSGQYYQSVNSVPSNVVPLYYGNSNQYQYASADKYQQYYQIQQQPAQVFKHFYVHAAPEEPELPKPRAPIVLPPPQKHYKIIFVKTPNVVSRSSVVAPVQPQNEEKTIVYVLVKKPEEQQEVIVPKVEQKPPSKPEVYFIKYNNKDDDKAVINNIVNDYNKPGQTVSISGGDSDGLSSGQAYSDLPVVTSFSNFPAVSSGISSVPSGSSFSSVPVVSSVPSGSSFSSVPVVSSVQSGSSFSSVPVVSSIPSGSSFSSVPVVSSFPSSSSFASVPSGSSFSSVPSGSSFSAIPTGSSFSSFPSGSSFSNVASGQSLSGSPSGSGIFSSNVFDSGVAPNVQVVSTVRPEPVKIPASSFGSQSFVNTVKPVTLSSFDSGVSSSAPQFVTTVKPVGTSTVAYDDQENFNAISTSQGIPHETYGPPKFRV